MIDKLRDYISVELEKRTFEEILEDFDIFPEDVFIMLFNNGHVDEDVFQSKCDCVNG